MLNALKLKHHLVVNFCKSILKLINNIKTIVLSSAFVLLAFSHCAIKNSVPYSREFFFYNRVTNILDIIYIYDVLKFNVMIDISH